MLSEGEQRIVALAAFFADATGRNEQTPIIIDDPISSLDYNYEEQYCQKGCTMQELNVTSGTVACLCPPNNGFGNLSIDNIDDNVYQEESVNINIDTNKDKYNTQKYSYTNIKALQCVKGIFNTKRI